MLDDINSELLSIYPGTFPNPRPFSKKPLIYNSGFHVHVRPSLPLYRVQCNNDYIAEKSKKAEAAIRKLYKAAAHTGSAASFRETSSIFQHEIASETILSKYRDNHIYTKSRLRKVNRKQLIKAMNLAKRKEEEDIKKQFDTNISKVEQEPTVSRTKMKQRSYGALRIENRVFKIKKSLASASVPEPYNLNENLDNSSSPDNVTNCLEVHTRDTEKEVLSKPKCPLTVRRPAIAKKLSESIRKPLNTCDGQVPNVVLQNKEYACREEEGETAGLMKKPPLKQGNYTKIVTLKKKTWLKPETTVEISSFPFANQNSGKRNSGMLQKIKKEESNNEIDHIYKINDVSRSMRVKQGYQSSSRTGFYKYSGAANPNENMKETKVYKSDESDNDITLTVDIQETLKTELEEDETKEPLPTLVQKRNIRRNVPKYKYGGYKTDSVVPHGLQLQESAPLLQPEESSPRLQSQMSKSLNLPLIEGSDGGRSDSRYRLRKAVKREERYLSLPKITPTLTIDEPRDHSRNRRTNYRASQMQHAGRREIVFANYR